MFVFWLVKARWKLPVRAAPASEAAPAPVSEVVTHEAGRGHGVAVLLSHLNLARNTPHITWRGWERGINK